jgi:hypothetical protein
VSGDWLQDEILRTASGLAELVAPDGWLLAVHRDRPCDVLGAAGRASRSRIATEAPQQPGSRPFRSRIRASGVLKLVQICLPDVPRLAWRRGGMVGRTCVIIVCIVGRGVIISNTCFCYPTVTG